MRALVGGYWQSRTKVVCFMFVLSVCMVLQRGDHLVSWAAHRVGLVMLVCVVVRAGSDQEE